MTEDKTKIWPFAKGARILRITDSSTIGNKDFQKESDIVVLKMDERILSPLA